MSVALFVGIGDTVLRPSSDQQRPFGVRNSELLHRLTHLCFAHSRLVTTDSDIVPTVRQTLDLLVEAQINADFLFLYISTSLRVCGDDVRLFMWDSDPRAPLDTYLSLDDLVSACVVPTVVVLDAVYEVTNGVVFPTGYCNSYPPNTQFIVTRSNDRDNNSLSLRILNKVFEKGSVSVLDLADVGIAFPARRNASSHSIVAVGTAQRAMLSAATVCDAVLQLSLPLAESCPKVNALDNGLRPATLLSLWTDSDICSLILHVAPEGFDAVREWLASLACAGIVLRRALGMFWFVTAPKGQREVLFRAAPPAVLMMRWTVSVSLRMSLHQWVWVEARCRERAHVKGLECMYEAISMPSGLRGDAIEERVSELERRHAEGLTDRGHHTSELLARVDGLSTDIRAVAARMAEGTTPTAPTEEWERAVTGVKNAAAAVVPTVTHLTRKCEEQTSQIRELEMALEELKCDRASMESEHRQEMEALRVLASDRLQDAEKAYVTRGHSDVQVLAAIEDHAERELTGLGAGIHATMANVVARVQRVEATVAPVDSLGAQLIGFVEYAGGIQSGAQRMLADHEELLRELREVTRLAMSLEGVASGGVNTFLRPAVQDLVAKEVRAVLDHGASERRSHMAVLEHEILTLHGRVDTAVSRVTDPDMVQRIAAQVTHSADEVRRLAGQVSDMSDAIALYNQSLSPLDVAERIAKATSDADVLLTGLARTAEEIAGAVVAVRVSRNEIAEDVRAEATVRAAVAMQLQDTIQETFRSVLVGCEERIAKAEKTASEEIHGLAEVVRGKVDHHSAAARLWEKTSSLQTETDARAQRLSMELAKFQEGVRGELVVLREAAGTVSDSTAEDTAEALRKVRGLTDDTEKCSRDTKTTANRIKEVSLAVAEISGFIEAQKKQSGEFLMMEERLAAIEELARKLSKRST